MICSTNYICIPKWYTSDDQEENGGQDVLILPDNIYQEDIVIVVEPKTGDVQIQFKDSNDEWFTPAESEFTIDVKTVKCFNRKNMPKSRIIATGDATFSISGSL